jgi:glyoxylase-like metal-dependent hydrolase (beta-lactamase superfamily II)
MNADYGLPPNIRLIDDFHLGQPHVVATYVLLGDEPAIVDPGPASALPTLTAGLAEHGIAIADLRAVLLTHIHLDHAGATGSLVRAAPHLRVYVHQRGAPHMVAPDKLLGSAARIYGERMHELWGEFLPVPESNLTRLTGGETLQIGERQLAVYDAPGHAYHHVLYYEAASAVAFVGDTVGVSLTGTTDVRPATPPPEVDLEAWRGTLDTLLALEPHTLCLTHFGPSHDAERHITTFWERTLHWAEQVRADLAAGADDATAAANLAALAERELGPDTPAAVRAQYAQAAAVPMSYSGLTRYWRKKNSITTT